MSVSTQPVKIGGMGLQTFTAFDLDSIADALGTEGFIVLPGAFSRELATRAVDEIEGERSSFKDAGIGKAGEKHAEIRRDQTMWWDLAAPTLTQAVFLEAFESLRVGLNSRLFLGLFDLEGHYAFYPPGAFYRTHVDRFKNDSRRTVSLVAFFNADWPGDAGGELRLETPVGEKRILPEAGTIVLFLSAQIPHEVLLTRRGRYSFAGWFRERERER